MARTDSKNDRAEAFSPALFALVAAAIQRTGGSFPTLGKTPAPNEVVSFNAAGVYVVTSRVADQAQVPQLIPAWMFERAVAHLRQHGTLTNQQLLKDLRVMRSSAVCAILARLEGVRHVGPGITLEWTGPR